MTFKNNTSLTDVLLKKRIICIVLINIIFVFYIKFSFKDSTATNSIHGTNFKFFKDKIEDNGTTIINGKIINSKYELKSNANNEENKNDKFIFEDKIDNIKNNINSENKNNKNESNENGDKNEDKKKVKDDKKDIKEIKVKKVVKLGNGYTIEQTYTENNIIKKEPLYDKYGVDLNQYIMDGMINKALDNNTSTTIEKWSLYTPPCPNLHPVHYSDDILNPVCENIAIPLINIKTHINVPYILRLNNITSQMEKFEEWKKTDGKIPDYKSESVKNILNENYHPYDYGYYDLKKNEDEDYYSKVIKSPMDQVPDPRRRRLFSMILFNSEFELLDLYLAENYEIVDYFIIYESNATFSGYKKPLYLTRTLLETNRYEKFRDKIIPVTLPVLEMNHKNKRGPAFPREHLARRQVIEKGLRAVNARHGDLYFHGDLDELPKARLLSYLKKCGGWEHLQKGFGGPPKSMKDPLVKSYIRDKSSPVAKSKVGQYKINYDLFLSLGFNSFFHEYSFNTIKNKFIGSIFHPNIAIFDARRSLGQYPEYTLKGNKFNVTKYSKEYNHVKRQETKNNTMDINENNNGESQINEMYTDEDRDMGIDPYQGYTYTDNDTADKKGEGFLGEYMRFATKINKNTKDNQIAFYKSGWHLSSFLPNMANFLNKFQSYSHYNSFNNLSIKEKKEMILERIRDHRYIIGDIPPMKSLKVKLPKTEEEKVPSMYSYQTWEIIQKEFKDKKKSKSFGVLNKHILHEMPRQVWENPICYSYMIDRDFGFSKKLWWEVVQEEEWDSVDFSKLNSTILDEITPLRKEDKKKKKKKKKKY